MNQKIKKRIAREGLVILGILIASVGSFLKVWQMEEKNGQYVYSVSINGRVFEFVSKEEIEATYEVQKDILIKLRDNGLLSENDDAFLHPLETKMAISAVGRAPLDWLSKLHNVLRSSYLTLGFALLILGYPVYLFVLFTAWAVKTLRD